MRRALAVYRGLVARRLDARYLSSGKGSGDVPPPPTGADLEDDFDELSFNVAPEEVEVPPPPEIDTTGDEEVTPEMATELVERMVAAATATRSAEGRAPLRDGITAHTISVLRASRITTNEVLCPGATDEDYPINRKVVAELDVASLGLSPPAEVALQGIAGSRWTDGRVRLACYRLASSEENQAVAVARLEHLVRAAKGAVGEVVDERALASWDEVREEVGRQLDGVHGASVEAVLRPRHKEREFFTAMLPSSVAFQ